jgi:hypothetical protein
MQVNTSVAVPYLLPISVDEAHRLKNLDCNLASCLKRYRSEFRLLLTVSLAYPWRISADFEKIIFCSIYVVLVCYICNNLMLLVIPRLDWFILSSCGWSVHPDNDSELKVDLETSGNFICTLQNTILWRLYLIQILQNYTAFVKSGYILFIIKSRSWDVIPLILNHTRNLEWYHWIISFQWYLCPKCFFVRMRLTDFWGHDIICPLFVCNKKKRYPLPCYSIPE